MVTQNNKLALAAEGARLLCLSAIYEAQSGHTGGSLSCMDILATLYFDVMHIDPKKPRYNMRDRFVLSKGHCAPALYSVLALRGFFPVEEMKLFRSINGHLSGHVEMNQVAGVDMSTGSLGQGISAAVGMALAAKTTGKTYRVYAVLGDGELVEGQVWEAVLSATKYKLDNLCAIVDVNGLQIDGKTSEVMPTEPLDEKFRAFGCNTLCVDGHDFDQLRSAFLLAKAVSDRPTVVLAKTTKGKGVSFMEGDAGWHGKAPNEEEYTRAKEEICKRIAELEGQ